MRPQRLPQDGGPSTLGHAATLPPSAHRLHPNLHPAAMLLLVPSSIQKSRSLPPPDTLVQVSGRLATLRLTEDFLNPQREQPSPMVPPIALISPCLAAVVSAPLRVFAVEDPQDTMSEVVVNALLPAVDAKTAKIFADGVADALRGREAVEGDVVPVARGAVALVVRVSGKGVCGPNTRIAVAVGKGQRSASISESVKTAARACWAPRQFWPAREPLRRLDWCVQKAISTVAVQGLTRDVDDLFCAFAAASPSFDVSGRDAPPNIMAMIRRAEDARLPPAVVCRAENGMESGVVDLLLKAACRENPVRSFDVDDNLPRAFDSDERDRTKAFTVFVTCEDLSELPEAILQRVEVEVHLPVPDEGERRRILEEEVFGLESPTGIEDQLVEMARMSTGFAHAELTGLASVFQDGGIESCRSCVNLFGKGKLTVDAGGVTWGDIGGLEDAKEQILDLVDMTAGTTGSDSRNPIVNVNRRVGILLYGPPGTGKTLLARAVAGECGCSFISVKGPELLDMYVGESEKNVREVFSRAASVAPCVLFFDELDALAPSRGRGSDSGGVADRVVSQLVAELDGIVARSDVFVIAASNRPDLVDPGLLRPGRLDKMIYVSMPLSRKEQQAILVAQTRKFAFAGDVDFAKVLSFAAPPPTLSGADLYALATNAWMHAAKGYVQNEENVKSNSLEDNTERNDSIGTALRQAAEWVEKGAIYKGWFSAESDNEERRHDTEDHEDVEVTDEASTVHVSEEDFIAAASELQPSLNSQQLREYEELRIRIETGV